MNFSQMHERLRLELLRRIQRGTLSVSLLARQTGFGQSHISNFLRNQRQLSLEAMDRILASQRMVVADLLPATAAWPRADDTDNIPVVSHATAMHEPLVRPSAVQRILRLPAGQLKSARSRPSAARRAWLRFVAIAISESDAQGMEPVLVPNATAVLDRHYNSLVAYRPGRANLYAVRYESRLLVRYLDFQANRLLLRPHDTRAPVHLVEIEPDLSPPDLIAGRVILVINEV